MQSVLMLSVNYAECRKQAHYAELHYAELHYAECRYSECRGAGWTAIATLAKVRTLNEKEGSV